MAGDSGDGCIVDAECADDDPCNGEERCSDGTCQAGPSACGELTEGCTCTETDEGTCVVAALDADADQHGSALCKTAPGDDCDDGDAKTYPGATELCDGKDNDCDGLRDLDEGLEPMDEIVPLAPSSTSSGYDVAWSPEAGAYGVSWVAPVSFKGIPSDFLHFGLVYPSGKYEKSLDSLTALGDDSSYQLKVAYGYGEFAIAYLHQPNGGGATSLGIQRVGKTGKASLGNPVEIALGQDSITEYWLFRPTEHDWVVVFFAYSSKKTWATRITDGAVVAAESAVSLSRLTKYAPLESVAGRVSFRSGDAVEDRWLAFNGAAQPVAGGGLGFSLDGQTLVAGRAAPELGVVASSYSQAVERFSTFSAARAMCSNVVVPYTPKSFPAQVVKNPDAWLLVHGDSSKSQGYGTDDIVLSQVFADCSASQGGVRLPLVPVATAEGLKAAGGEQGSAVVWREATAGALFARLLGPNVCQAP